MEHPLTQLMNFHYQEFTNNKKDNESLPPIEFNRNYGLSINAPLNWPYADAVVSVIKAAGVDQKRSVIIFPSTSIYDSIRKRVETGAPVSVVNYVAWHEIYFAMNHARMNVIQMDRLRDMLKTAGLVIFIGATTTVPEVIDQVRVLCEEGCLIILG